MQTIRLSAVLHKHERRMVLAFELSTRLNNIVRKIPGSLWSKTLNSWHIPCTRDALGKLALATAGFAVLDTSVLQKQLLEVRNKESKLEIILPGKIHTSLPVIASEKVAVKNYYRSGMLIAANEAAFAGYTQMLELKAYSPSTIRTYTNEFGVFLKVLNTRAADSITPEELKRYMHYCTVELNLSENSLHSRLNALKFYFEQVLHKEKFFFEIPRPKKPYLLPKLLNETEIRKLFNALTNKKHKAMLFTAYSAGLRVSEIVHLKISDIDSKRMQIFISRAKGKKDRYVNLSPVLLDILRNYLTTYKPSPREYLFESGVDFTAYPIRTVQQIFSNAKNKAGIKKEVGIHSLRHSFATHLLDKGTDIKYIKDLLGHFSIRTTERYLHVSKKQLINIISPFDDLWNSENIDW